MQKVVVHAPAKLNLALDVVGLLDNGYHAVDMVMQTVDVYEHVEIAKSEGYSLACPGSKVPCDERNTATKAAMAFFRETGLLAGCDITIHKAVPARAGMAGGSADAAAVLVGLNRLYGARLKLEELRAIGAEVGADVPFSILGGTARASGIGERLEPLPPLPNCWFTISMPHGGGVSTPEAYARFDTLETPFHPDVEGAVQAIRAGDLVALCNNMRNALETATGDAITELTRTVLDANGALASMMTGSGAAVFGVFMDMEKAKRAAEALDPYAQEVFVAQPVAEGARVVAVE